MTTARPIERILVLGGGAVVRECYLPALKALGLEGRTTVIDPAGLADLKKLYPACTFEGADFREYMKVQTDAFQAVIIALPNSLHEEAALSAFACGMHVLCEKPLALSSASCLRMAEAAGKSGCLLAVNMVRRLFPSIREAKRALDYGMIGDLASVEMEHGSPYAWPALSLSPFLRENGGVLADMGTHYLDLADFFAGELEPADYSDDCHGGVEADFVFHLRSTKGIPVRIAVSRTRNLGNRVRLVGTRGWIDVPADDFKNCSVSPADGSAFQISSLEPYRAGDFEPSFNACFAQQVTDFLAAARGQDVPFVDGAAAARAVTLIEWAYRNRKSHPVVSVSGPALEKAPALVTGATGFIGTHLVERLVELGMDDIVTPIRSPQTCAPLAVFPVRLKPLDLLNASHVREIVRGRRWVFHLAFGRDGQGQDRITVDGTKNIVNAAIENGCEAVVVLSTIYVLGSPPGVVDETFPYRPIGEYGRAKARMERWCLERSKKSGPTRIIVLNPSCVYGPRGKAYSELPATLAGRGAFGWIELGRGIANYIFVTNLVDAMLLAAAKPEAHGQRFILNDGSASWREFLGPIVEPRQPSIGSYTQAELRRLAGEPSGSLLSALRLATADPSVRQELKTSRLAQTVLPLLRKYGLRPGSGPAERPPVLRKGAGSLEKLPPPVWLGELFGPRTTVFSSGRARQVLGWNPRIGLAEGQRRTLAWLEHAHPAC